MEEFTAQGRRPERTGCIGLPRKKATTAAGIYAKATICRASATGAAGLAMSLAMSLAIDLLDCEELRKSALARGGAVMPQHLWQKVGPFRICEVCQVYQARRHLPTASRLQFCRGDDDDDGARGRRRKRPPPQPSPRLEELTA